MFTASAFRQRANYIPQSQQALVDVDSLCKLLPGCACLLGPLAAYMCSTSVRQRGSRAIANLTVETLLPAIIEVVGLPAFSVNLRFLPQ